MVQWCNVGENMCAEKRSGITLAWLKVSKEIEKVIQSYRACCLRNIVQIGPETLIEMWSCARESDLLEYTVT